MRQYTRQGDGHTSQGRPKVLALWQCNQFPLGIGLLVAVAVGLAAAWPCSADAPPPSSRSVNASATKDPLASATSKPLRERYDVVVYCATPGGIAAALGAARRGSPVALVEPSPFIGGMMAGGLGATDVRSRQAAGTIFREFTGRVEQFYNDAYGPDTQQVKDCRGGWYFEPRVARDVFEIMLEVEPNLTLLRNHRLRWVNHQRGRVSAMIVSDPRGRFVPLRADVFVDASYEGDLAAKAGAQYRIGREGRNEFGEEYAGEIFWDTTTRKVVMGSGAGDRHVQAYNYRFTLTDHPDNRRLPGAPIGYNRETYLDIAIAVANGRAKRIADIIHFNPLPNRKFDINNMPGPFPSTDLIGPSDEYPEASDARRAYLRAQHRDYILGLLYFLQNDPALPESFRAQAREWGLARDEFEDHDNFPTQLYVREARRIIGDYLFTENDARSPSPNQRAPIHCDSIGVAEYPLDSHATTPRRPERPDLWEGFFYVPSRQSQIPYRILLPQGLDNVLVCCAISATHVGYGTLRLEPTMMSMGYAAGTVGHLVAQGKVALRELDIAALQRELAENRQALTWFKDVDEDTPHFAALQYLGTHGFFPTYDARPADTLTRDTAAIWLLTLVTQEKPELAKEAQGRTAATPSYTDLPSDHPAFEAATALSRLGIIRESALAGQFQPEQPLLQGEMARWLVKTMQIIKGWDLPEDIADNASDAPPESEYSSSVNTLSARRLIGEGPAGKLTSDLDPTATITRADFAGLVYAALFTSPQPEPERP